MTQIEIKIRSFFRCDEANIVPVSTFLFDLGKLDKIDFPSIIRKIHEQYRVELDGAPFTNIREMETDEVAAYLDNEDQ